MGTPDFSVPTLEAVHFSNRFEVSLAVTQPDKPRGRGREVSATPVRKSADLLGIPVAIKTRANYGELFARIVSLKPDFIVVAAFSMILPVDLLDLPRLGCINLHASLLPKYRGVSPVQASILSGDESTGCTTMLMDEGIDTGDILLQIEQKIDPEETSGSLACKLAAAGADLLVRTLEGVADGKIQPKKQDDSKATHTRKIKKSDGIIDWGMKAVDLNRLVRAMNPWPSAYGTFRGKRIIVLESRPLQGGFGGASPGAIVSLDPLAVECGEGRLELRMIKIEGKKALDSIRFVSGYRIQKGERLL